MMLFLFIGSLCAWDWLIRVAAPRLSRGYRRGVICLGWAVALAFVFSSQRGVDQVLKVTTTVLMAGVLVTAIASAVIRAYLAEIGPEGRAELKRSIGTAWERVVDFCYEWKILGPRRESENGG